MRIELTLPEPDPCSSLAQLGIMKVNKQRVSTLKDLEILKNFHTHTYRCGHATGNVSDFVKSALQNNITHLGISDHVPLPDGKWDIRMPYKELPEYVRDIEEAQESNSEIKIYKSAECDYAQEYVNYFKEELLGKYKMDYLMGGVHFIPRNKNWINCYYADNSKESLFAYTNYLIDVIDCDLFAFIAHPDVFAVFYHLWDSEAVACSRAILEAASSKNRILEINGSGYRKNPIETPRGWRRPYPIDEFWLLAAEYNIRVIINSDAHRPEDVADFGESFQLARELGLEVVDLKF